MAASRLLARSFALSPARSQTTRSTRPIGFLPLLHQFLQASPATRSSLQLYSLRAYATTNVERSKQSGSSKAQPSKKATAKKPASGKSQARKKSVKKPAKKAAKKPARKSAKKPAKRAVKKKTERQLLTQKISGLRKVALLEEPKRRATTVWTVYNQQHLAKGQQITEQLKENGRRYRNLSTSEREVSQLFE